MTPTLYVWIEKVQPEDCTFSEEAQRLWDMLPHSAHNTAYLDEVRRPSQPLRVRCQRLAALTCLLQAMGQVCPHLLSRITLQRTDDKRPFAVISGDDASVLSFSLTHTDTLSACALLTGEGTVGIDIEHLIPLAKAERLSERFFLENEKSQMPHGADLSLWTTRIWTAKEACFKCGGYPSLLGCDTSVLPQGSRLWCGQIPAHEAVISVCAPSDISAPVLLSPIPVIWEFADFRADASIS